MKFAARGRAVMMKDQAAAVMTRIELPGAAVRSLVATEIVEDLEAERGRLIE
jgi:hypothetical protein